MAPARLAGVAHALTVAVAESCTAEAEPPRVRCRSRRVRHLPRRFDSLGDAAPRRLRCGRPGPAFARRRAGLYATAPGRAVPAAPAVKGDTSPRLRVLRGNRSCWIGTEKFRTTFVTSTTGSCRGAGGPPAACAQETLAIKARMVPRRLVRGELLDLLEAAQKAAVERRRGRGRCGRSAAENLKCCQHISKTSVESWELQWMPVNSQNTVSDWDSNS
jgi:hypothetical protein